MTTAGKRTILFISGIGLLGVSLYYYFNRQSKLLEDSDFKVVDIVVTNLSKENVTLDLYVEYHNKSAIKATVNKIFLDIFVQGVKVAEISQTVPFVVDPSSTKPFVLNASFNPKALLQNVVDLLLSFVGSTIVEVRASGYASVSSGFISATIPVDYSKTIGI